MKVQLVVVGKVKGVLADAVAEYEKRAARYWKLEVVEVTAGAGGRDAPADTVKEAEAERILSRIAPGLAIIALARGGRTMDSNALSQYLDELGIRASPGAAFVIGGAFGLHERVLAAASRKMALSSMTLPHEMARMILVEQIYRAGTILRGEPYHKG
jgi:23S rRNA (pseudouridine1915-N3)-methyltransferase